MIHQVKCTNCGASLTLSENKENIDCSYCGSTFINEMYSPNENVFQTNTVITTNTETNVSTDDSLPAKPSFGFGEFMGVVFGLSLPFTMCYLFGTLIGIVATIGVMLVLYILIKTVEYFRDSGNNNQ